MTTKSASGPAPSGHRLPKALGAVALSAGLMSGGYGAAWAATAHSSVAATGGGPAGGSSHPGPGTPPSPPAAPLGGSSPAPPKGPPPGPPGPGPGPGFLTAIATNSLTVEGRDGRSVTVSTTTSTRYREGGARIARTALMVGDPLRIASVASSSTSSSAPVASEVDLVRARIRGLVVSVSGSDITIDDFSGFQRTVMTSSSTSYTDGGKSASGVKVGQVVTALGTVGSDHATLDAEAIEIGPPGPPPPPSPGPAPSQGSVAPSHKG